MEITWYGHACFRLAERGLSTVITDPYDPSLLTGAAPRLKGDIVLSSQDGPLANALERVEGSPHRINGAGEYEIGGVFITGIQDGKPGGPRSTLYVMDFDGITIAHLGGLSRVPTQSEIEAIGPIHVALMPVGGNDSLTAAKAAEIIPMLEPNIVIPMVYQIPHSALLYEPLAKFLKEMGITEIETSTSFKFNGTAALPEETRLVILDPQAG